MCMKDFVTAVVVGVMAVLTALGCAWLVAPTVVAWHGLSISFVAVVVAFGLNWLAFVPAAALKTERFYDLTGSLTFISVAAVVVAAVLESSLVSVTVPRLLPALFVVAWALRLGTFLALRIHRVGADARFDQLKTSPVRFFVPWTLQGLWVFLTSLAMLVQVGSTTTTASATDTTATIVGAVLWLVGFVVEVVADHQKTVFARDPKNRGRFVTTGLWSWSRHPNYFGEITLWSGLWVMGLAAYAHGQWIAVVSPLFVFLLLRFVSGVPLLERRADARFGGDANYLAWRDATPLLWPRPPRRS
jgi:steroid 5-alpha reductase family enzyme